MSIVLNGFEVDPALAQLMLREDWRGKRTDGRWLERFPAHPECEGGRLPFVEFCQPEWAERENEALRKPENSRLLGKSSRAYPPDDLDPTAGYLIGFTDMADAPICVDLRPATPRIIYDCLANRDQFYATAFASIEEFVQFYTGLHGA
jgi:hypothetical protein